MAESMLYILEIAPLFWGLISRITSSMDSCGNCGNWDVLQRTKDLQKTAKNVMVEDGVFGLTDQRRKRCRHIQQVFN